jgi:peptidoglycan/LPS O-acetylase OafA/YrhL
LDVLKGLAIILIPIVHLSGYGFSFLEETYFLDKTVDRLLAEFSLSLFVIASGFGLAYSSLIKGKQLQLLSFAKKRFMRIYPLYYLALFLFIILKIQPIDVPTLVAYLLGMQALAGEYTHSWNILWFIGLIVLYYMLFPFFLAALKRNRLTLVLSALSILLISLLIHHLFGLFSSSYFSYFLPFLFGIYFADYFKRKENVLGKHFESKVFLLFVLMCIIRATMPSLPSETDIFTPIPLNSLDILIPNLTIGLNLLSHNLTQIFLFLTVFSMLLRVETIKPLIISRMSALGYASYGVYLFHIPAYEAIKHLFGSFDPTMRSLLYLASIPLIFLGSYIIQKGYDKILSRIER